MVINQGAWMGERQGCEVGIKGGLGADGDEVVLQCSHPQPVIQPYHCPSWQWSWLQEQVECGSRASSHSYLAHWSILTTD